MSTVLTSIIDHLDVIAALSGGLFAGVAFHVAFGETPALCDFGLNEHWRFFPYTYKRTAVMQGSFTIIAGIAGIVHGIRIVDTSFYRNLWLASGTTFIAIIPYTIGLLLPINKKIIEDGTLIESGKESSVNVATKKELLNRWSTLHYVRVIASLAGFTAMVYGITRHSSSIQN